VPLYQCQTASCDNVIPDDFFGLTASQACSKCYAGGYVRIVNENDQPDFLPDINTQMNYLFSFWARLSLEEGDKNLIRYKYEDGGNFRKFLYIENNILKLQYYYNGTFEVFELPNILENNKQYSFVVTASKIGSSRRRLRRTEDPTSNMELRLMAHGYNEHWEKSWVRVMSNPAPTVYDYEIRDEIQNTDFVFGFHTMSRNEEEVLHANNMMNWEPEITVKTHNILPIVICGATAAIICVLSIMVNICSGHELPEVLAFIAPTFALLDFTTDAQLAYVLFDDHDDLRWWGLGVVLIPLLLNLLTLFRWFYRNISADTFLGRWIRQHITWVKLLMFVSSTNVAVMKVAWSQLFPHAYFMIPISFNNKIKLLRWGSVITTFVEDIPSLILQITILRRTGRSDYISLAVWLALYTSCISLLYGIIESCTNLKPTSGTALRLQISVSNPKRALLFRKKTIESALKRRFANTQFDVLILENTRTEFLIEAVVYSPEANISDISEAIEEVIQPYITDDTNLQFHQAPQASKILELLLSVKALCESVNGGIRFEDDKMNVDFESSNQAIMKELMFLFNPTSDAEGYGGNQYDWTQARIAKDVGQTWERMKDSWKDISVGGADTPGSALVQMMELPEFKDILSDSTDSGKRRPRSTSPSLFLNTNSDTSTMPGGGLTSEKSLHL